MKKFLITLALLFFLSNEAQCYEDESKQLQNPRKLDDRWSRDASEEAADHGKTELLVRVQRLEESLKRLNGNLQQAMHDNQVLAGKLDNISQSDSDRLKNLETQIAQLNQQLVSLTAKVAKQNPALYNAQLVTEGKYDEALEGFKQYLNELGDDAQSVAKKTEVYHWMGKAYYDQKLYEKAVLYFIKSYKQDNKAARANESYIKLIKSLVALKSNADACDLLQGGSKFASSMSSVDKAYIASAKLKTCNVAKPKAKAKTPAQAQAAHP